MDFNGKDGSRVLGYEVHTQREEDNLEGFAVRSFFVSDAKVARAASCWSPMIGDRVVVSFKTNGKVDDLFLLDSGGKVSLSAG